MTWGTGWLVGRAQVVSYLVTKGRKNLSRIPSSLNRYEARILMERVAREDMDTRTLHQVLLIASSPDPLLQLRVTNTAGTTTFDISIDTGRSCQCRSCH